MSNSVAVVAPVVFIGRFALVCGVAGLALSSVPREAVESAPVGRRDALGLDAGEGEAAQVASSAAHGRGEVAGPSFPMSVPFQMLWSGSRAVTCGDQINRDAGPPKVSSDLVPEAWMPGGVSVDLVHP
ncbi:hypothetical protein [Kitasatospora purpeofusca]|uniref:hypothetical protein n=1 Tax=Kitasatospora purpeofusca TaxID=67352 RepID=UPI002A59D629|nr:hypothetical protein [Kitasatospora purpeofusca]MDY0816790.1 hypothetical protein [Kitasatospora purpeofusca]